MLLKYLLFFRNMNRINFPKMVVIVIFLTCLSRTNLVATNLSFVPFDSTVVHGCSNLPRIIYFHFDGCGLCKRMENEVFTDSIISSVLKGGFCAIEVNLRTGKGDSLSKHYGVNLFPAFVFVNDSGDIINIFSGFYNKKEFLNLLKYGGEYKNSLNYYTQEYKRGNRKSEFLLEYSYKLADANRPDSVVINQYLHDLSDVQLRDTTNIHFIYKFSVISGKEMFNYNGRIYNFIKKNVQLFNERFDSVQVNTRLMFLVLHEVYRSIQYKDSVRFFSTLVALKQFDGQLYFLKELDGREIVWTESRFLVDDALANYYQNTGEMKSYYSIVEKKIKAIWNNHEELNSLAWKFFETPEHDSRRIELALKMAKRSISINNNYYNNDTYAHLLKLKGNRKKALDYAHKALALAKLGNIDTTATQILINEIGRSRY